jgi:uncharacterized protein
MNAFNDKIIILYHDHCIDGFASAYAAWKYFGYAENIEYIPVQYGSAPPDITNSFIYILDFSYSTAEMEMLCKSNIQVIVLDHHKGAAQQINNVKADNFLGTCAEDNSGAVLAWKFFHQQIPVPKMLLHIQDRDLWKFELPETKAICYALYSEAVVARTFEAWDEAASQLPTLISTGNILLANFQKRCEQIVEHQSYEAKLYGGNVPSIHVLAANVPAEYASEVGMMLAAKSSSGIALIWQYLGKGITKCSLRSIGDVDCIPIAKYYGGGGHRNASGFTLTKHKNIREYLYEQP